jgi:hypothetical protein
VEVAVTGITMVLLITEVVVMISELDVVLVVVSVKRLVTVSVDKAVATRLQSELMILGE